MSNETGAQNFHKIGDYLVQFKKLGDLLDLEWRLLVPGTNIECVPALELPPKKKRKMSNSIQNAYQPSNYKPSPKTSSLTELKTQYDAIIKSVEIPKLYFKAMETAEKIRKVISGPFPNCEVHLFRNHYLKIENPLCSNRPDFLLFVNGGPKTKGFKKLKIELIEKLLLKSKNIFPNITKSASSTALDKQCDLDKKIGQRFSSQISSFHLYTDLYFGIEAQLCRLLSYMCKFDWRLFPMISLLNYFCTANSCNFDDPLFQGETMEWLIILFMSKEKHIPTVREVLNQPHNPIWQVTVKRKVDIGFDHSESNFLRESYSKNCQMDEETMAYSVIDLFQQFLSFCGKTLGNGNLILNIRDSEVLDRNMIFTEESEGVPLKTKLTEEEIRVIRKSGYHQGKWDKWPFSIMNPLVVEYKLGYKLKEVGIAVRLMNYAASQLQKFVNGVVEKNVGVNKGDLENILRIDESTRITILKEKVPWCGNRKKCLKEIS